MQDLQADQSLYNRKGVCYILFNTWSFPGVKNTVFLIVTANIINYLIFPAIIKGKPTHTIPKSKKLFHRPIESLSLK